MDPEINRPRPSQTFVGIGGVTAYLAGLACQFLTTDLPPWITYVLFVLSLLAGQFWWWMAPERTLARVAVRWGISLIIAVLFILACYLKYTADQGRALSTSEGFLKPDLYGLNPPDRCGGAGDIAVFLGSNVFHAWKFPFPILAFNGTPILSIDAFDESGMEISADIKGRDGRIVARITQNEFVLNDNNLLRKTRPDHHTLLVEDQFGETVLDFRFATPSTVVIRGIFRDGSGREFQINESDIVIMPNDIRLRGLCFERRAAALNIGRDPNGIYTLSVDKEIP